ncbi:MAG: hypothetical protein WC635_13015 [Bacteriovorax sp.]|jgi:hypothetical protein
MKILQHAILTVIILALAGSLGNAQEAVPLFKDQKNSATKWGEVNIKSFLSLKDWKEQTYERDLFPEWETVIRERNNREVVGRFFQCTGNCRIDRGQSFFNPNHRTAIYEGDEIQTIGDSYAWIFLFDGTMVRLSPESSINLNELNIGVKENFLSARVNTGNILWLSRNEALFQENNLRETDVLFFPLALYDAQPVPDRKPYIEDNLLALVEEKETVLNQTRRLNGIIEQNNLITRKKPTFAFIVMPNITIMGHNPSLEIVSILGGKTFFKKRSHQLLGLKTDDPEEETVAQMRGFENTALTALETDKWMLVDEKGRSLTPTDENIHMLTMGEFMTRHIPSLMVARELFLAKYSSFAFREKYDPMELARNDGYRLWGLLKTEDQEKKQSAKQDMELRLDYLKEYFRRVETTNLLVSTHFSERLKERGETLKSMEYGSYFFIKALKKYYSYEEYSDETESGVVLNSTTKPLWKRMHGLK